MIFVTVGAQMAFDRLVTGVDEWAQANGRKDVFAQIGPTEETPTHIRWTHFLPPSVFRSHMKEASAVVAHAGMGSILTALQVGVPILVMPRRADLRETRNDHQVATAERFQELGRVAVAMDETELSPQLHRIDALAATDRISAYASPELLDCLGSFIRGRRGEDG